eukprot:scaffold3639_cov141-Isochrysis_galbana.AAC.18
MKLARSSPTGATSPRWSPPRATTNQKPAPARTTVNQQGRGGARTPQQLDTFAEVCQRGKSACRISLTPTVSQAQSGSTRAGNQDPSLPPRPCRCGHSRPGLPR